MFWQILFWILFVLLVIGALVPDATVPGGTRSRWIIVLILLGLLGWAVYGGVDQPPRHRVSVELTAQG